MNFKVHPKLQLVKHFCCHKACQSDLKKKKKKASKLLSGRAAVCVWLTIERAGAQGYSKNKPVLESWKLPQYLPSYNGLYLSIYKGINCGGTRPPVIIVHSEQNEQQRAYSGPRPLPLRPHADCPVLLVKVVGAVYNLQTVLAAEQGTDNFFFPVTFLSTVDILIKRRWNWTSAKPKGKSSL